MSADERAKTPRPGLAQPVIVTTAKKIGGQDEHAAIITGVVSDDVVHVLLMPAGEQPYPISGVPHVKSVSPGALSWRWPSRR